MKQQIDQAKKKIRSENGPTEKKAFARSAPNLALHKDGGAIRAMGEYFATNPATGSMSLPIATSLERFVFGPQPSLSYDSGSDKRPFSFGWTLSLQFSPVRPTKYFLNISMCRNQAYLFSPAPNTWYPFVGEILNLFLNNIIHYKDKEYFSNVDWQFECRN